MTHAGNTSEKLSWYVRLLAFFFRLFLVVGTGVVDGRGWCVVVVIRI